MGRPADPWGATQARYQCRPNHRGQVHGNEKTAALARLEDLPAQSRRRHRRNGHVCRADGVVSIALRALILQHARRELLWLGVTAYPSAQWVAHQLTEAFGWKDPP